jgi:hypothetical protein
MRKIERERVQAQYLPTVKYDRSGSKAEKLNASIRFPLLLQQRTLLNRVSMLRRLPSLLVQRSDWQDHENHGVSEP